MAFTCSVHVSWIGVSEERQEVVCMAPHVLSCLSPKLFKAERGASLRQLILHGAVHAVTIRGDLFDLQVPLHQLLSQLQTLLMTGACEILHFCLSNPVLPFLLKSSLFVLNTPRIISILKRDFKLQLPKMENKLPVSSGLLMSELACLNPHFPHHLPNWRNPLHLKPPPPGNDPWYDMSISELHSCVSTWQFLGRVF